MKFLYLALFLSCLSLISAHVTVSPSGIPSSGSTFLTFNVPHSCDTNSLTYKMVMYFPPNITSIKPVNKAGWIVNQSSIDMGYQLSPGVPAYTLVYTYTAIPGNEFPTWTYDSFLFRLTAPSAPYAWTVGTKFYIPTYQYCTNGLMDAWNLTTTSSSTSETGAEPAPAFTILDPSAIQVVPTQANVQALATQLATVTNTTSNINHLLQTLSLSSDSSSSSWARADTISVIAIILSGLAILASLFLFNQLSTVEKQNMILRKKLQTLNEVHTQDVGTKDSSKNNTTKENIQLTPVASSEGHAEVEAPTFH